MRSLHRRQDQTEERVVESICTVTGHGGARRPVFSLDIEDLDPGRRLLGVLSSASGDRLVTQYSPSFGFLRLLV